MPFNLVVIRLYTWIFLAGHAQVHFFFTWSAGDDLSTAVFIELLCIRAARAVQVVQVATALQRLLSARGVQTGSGLRLLVHEFLEANVGPIHTRCLHQNRQQMSLIRVSW